MELFRAWVGKVHLVPGLRTRTVAYRQFQFFCRQGTARDRAGRIPKDAGAELFL